jgi:hypothetical protein
MIKRVFCSLVLCAAIFAQDARLTINKSLIPASGTAANEFVPKGWKIEEQLSGDLNADGASDLVLKLIEDKPAKTADDLVNDRARALIVLLKDGGQLARAAVADKLLQCTGCGGAFYGVNEAPADVQIEKGVIVVNQDHGSRELTNMTFRFRYDAATRQFVLIGFDYAEADRATATTVSESTNYLTGVRITSRDKGNGESKKRSVIAVKKISLDSADYEKFEEEADKRLGS